MSWLSLATIECVEKGAHRGESHLKISPSLARAEVGGVWDGIENGHGMCSECVDGGAFARRRIQCPARVLFAT
jgi:hypothetical protein